jgi:hypothetical protein
MIQNINKLKSSNDTPSPAKKSRLHAHFGTSRNCLNNLRVAIIASIGPSPIGAIVNIMQLKFLPVIYDVFS